ncbi:MAG: hypothetical protein J6X86_08520 [Bacteroidales bacterium]|nr:hypothetical protein [Bacteroidales bacterium]MBP5516973.1 hypothetical protein [Bacteroidales bacterium]
MKKIIVFVGLVAIFIFSSAFVTTGKECSFSNSGSGDHLYSVTVSITITKVFYDLNTGDKAFETNTSATQSFNICADNPDKAKSEAKGECSSVCSRNSGRHLGKELVNGKYYDVYEYREVYDAVATYIREC